MAPIILILGSMLAVNIAHRPLYPRERTLVPIE